MFFIETVGKVRDEENVEKILMANECFKFAEVKANGERDGKGHDNCK